MAMLTHPHVVAVYDFGETDGLYYFLMEFVDGVNLRRLLNDGKLAPAEALAIVPQVCDALQYAHDMGVVHRDIKPENILLDRRGQVKIADFGIAKLVGKEANDLTLTGAGQVVGTPQYMAPEQVEHPLQVDHRADIYSLGVVFYQMLTGELPIGRFAPPSKKVQIDVRLDEVVLRALEKEPERRYQQASEIKTRVETIVTTPDASGEAAGQVPASRGHPLPSGVQLDGPRRADAGRTGPRLGAGVPLDRLQFALRPVGLQQAGTATGSRELAGVRGSRPQARSGRTNSALSARAQAAGNDPAGGRVSKRLLLAGAVRQAGGAVKESGVQRPELVRRAAVGVGARRDPGSGLSHAMPARPRGGDLRRQAQSDVLEALRDHDATPAPRVSAGVDRLRR
jgi:hypothetical protein